MIVSPIVVIVILLAAFDAAFIKTSNLLNISLIDTKSVSRWYLASVNLYGILLTGFAFAMFAMVCCIICMSVIMVSKYIPIKGRQFIVKWMSPSKLFELLMPRYRNLHLAMVAVLVIVLAIGTGVFTRYDDCNDIRNTTMAARVQYKIIFTNIIAIMMCLVLLITYWVLNLLN